MDKKIVNVIWGDYDKTLYHVFYENGDTELVSVKAPKGNKLLNRIHQYYPDNIVDENQEEFDAMQAAMQTDLDFFRENLPEIKDYIENGSFAAKTLESIINLAQNEKEFFKLKLEVFEIPEVKSSKNRTWKSSMRKTKNALELLALLHQELPDLGNAPVGSLAKIPLQDITNQPDSPDSSQATDQQSPDTPSE